MSVLNLNSLRSLDLDGLGLIRYAQHYLENQGVVEDIECDLDTLVLPERSLLAALAMPVPPISAVLITAIYLRYIGQDVTSRNVLYTLHEYWSEDEAVALDLDLWRVFAQAAPEAAIKPEVLSEAGSYLATWVGAVLECVSNRFGFDIVS